MKRSDRQPSCFLLCASILEVSNIHIFFIIMQTALRRFKADIFQALAHPTRIAIIELLSGGELSAGELIARLGMEQATVSQHLAVLRSKQLVSNRKAGNQVFYTVRDPLIFEVLGLMRLYFQKNIQEAMEMLDEMDKSVRLSGPGDASESPLNQGGEI